MFNRLGDASTSFLHGHKIWEFLLCDRRFSRIIDHFRNNEARFSELQVRTCTSSTYDCTQQERCVMLFGNLLVTKRAKSDEAKIVQVPTGDRIHTDSSNY